jgi:acid phosphatase
MPSRYYQRTEQVPGGSDVDMIYIDTNPFVAKYAHDKLMGKEILSQDCGKQLAWIEHQLAASKAPWKIVFGHHPIYSGGEHGDTPELVDQLLPLLSKYGVQAYICGHDHDLQHLQAGGVNLFGSGAGSTVRPTKMIEQSKYSKSQPGFMAVSLKPELMEIRMIDGSGQMIYQTSVSQKLS